MEEEARLKWCKGWRDKLLAGQGPVHEAPEKMQWTMWGEQNRYFKLVPDPLGAQLVLVLWTGR